MANEVTKKDLDAINKRIDALSKNLEATKTWAKDGLDKIIKELTETDQAVNQHTKMLDETKNVVNAHAKLINGLQKGD